MVNFLQPQKFLLTYLLTKYGIDIDMEIDNIVYKSICACGYIQWIGLHIIGGTCWYEYP